MSNWKAFRWVFSGKRTQNTRRKPARPIRARGARLLLEPLEARITPANLALTPDNIMGPTSPGLALNAVLQSATAGSNYTEIFTATGGTGPYTFMLPWSGTGQGPSNSPGGVPGLKFTHNDVAGTATLAGTPPAGSSAGVYSFDVSVTDSAGAAVTQEYSISVSDPTSPGIFLNPDSGTDLPVGTLGTTVSQSFYASGGDGTNPITNFAFTATVNGTPVTSVDGLTLTTSATSATLSGMPTTAGAFPVTFSAVPLIGFTGVTTTGSAVVTGVSGGSSLVAGESVSGPGIATGTTIQSIDSGSQITLSAAVTSGNGTSVSLSAIELVPFMGSTTIDSQTVVVSSIAGLKVGQTVTGAGVPPGDTISSIGTNTITLALQATATGSGVSFSAGFTTSQVYTLSVNPSTLVIAPSLLQPGAVGVAYANSIPNVADSGNNWPDYPMQLAATGGIGTGYTFTAAGLPPGLSLSTAGILSGTPTVAGAYSVMLTVTDSALTAASQAYTLTILPGGSKAGTFTGNLASGSTTITNISAVAGNLAVGQAIAGTGIAPGTVITAFNGTSVTLSIASTAAASDVRFIGYGTAFTGTTTSDSKVISGVTTLGSLSNVVAGQTVSGPGIPSGAAVASVGVNSITLTVAATASATGAFTSAAGGFYSPQQIAQAYGINTTVLNGNVAATGAGTTIAILQEDTSSTLPTYDSSDMHFFNQVYGIPDFGSDPSSGPIFLRLNANGIGVNSFNGDTDGSTGVITNVSSTTGLLVGETVSGTGIPSDSIITAINTVSNTITLSKNTTAAGTGVLLTAGATSSGRGEEQDAQWAHALATGANIILFESGSKTYPTGNAVSGSFIITGISNLTLVSVGDSISGTGIPSDTYISAVDVNNDTITITNATTAGFSGAQLTATSTFASALAQIKALSAANNPNGIVLPSTITGSTGNVTIPGISVVSSSFSNYEYLGATYAGSRYGYNYIKYGASFNIPGVTIIEAAGDRAAFGARQGTSVPPTSPYALSVGMDELVTDDQGNYVGETGYANTGAGMSLFQPKPTYQNSVVTGSTTNRATPDVVFNGSGNSEDDYVYSYDSSYSPFSSGANGSSISAPSWAGLLADVNQGRILNGLPTLSAAQTLSLLYKAPSSDFHQIGTMNDGTSVNPSYNLFNGLGSPVANLLIPYLAGAAAPTLTPSTGHLAVNATTLVLTGSGFDGAGTNTVMLSSGTIQSVMVNSATQLTVTLNPNTIALGLLTATVTVDGVPTYTQTVANVVVPPTITSSTANLPASATTLTITGSGFDPVAANNSVILSSGATGYVSSATATSLTVTLVAPPTAGVLTAIVSSDGVSSGSSAQVAGVVPVVTSSTANQFVGDTTLIIHGVGFDPTASNNSVILSSGAQGIVTAATATQLTVTLVTPASLGVLTASVTVDGVSNGGAVSVATVVPGATLSVTSSTANLPANATTLIIHGTGFDPVAAHDLIGLSSGAGVVTAATATQLTVTLSARPSAGVLSAFVIVDGMPIPGLTPVATVVPVINLNTTTKISAPAPTSKTQTTTFTITGVGFDPVAAHDIVILSSGAGTVTAATATTLTVTMPTSAPPAPGPLSALVLVDGVASTGFTQVATVVAGVASPATSVITVSAPSITLGSATTITAASNKVNLPQGTINVVSTATFPSSGTISVKTSTGVQTVTYTGITLTSFTGCVGGTGTMSTGGAVTPVLTVTLQAKDGFGINLATGGSAVVFSLAAGSGTGTFSAVRVNAVLGTYTATFTPKSLGADTFVATLGGVKVTSTAAATANFQSTFPGNAGSNLGSPWLVKVPSAFTVNGGTATAGSAASNLATYNAVTQANVSESVTLPSLPNGATAALVARATPVGTKMQYYEAGITNGASGTSYTVFIQKVLSTGPVVPPLASVVINTPLPANALLTFELVGPSLRVFVNGSLAATGTDATLTAAGSDGILGTPGAQFKNFSATAIALQTAKLPYSDNFAATTDGQLSTFWPSTWQCSTAPRPRPRANR
jgi:hypothetical protein